MAGRVRRLAEARFERRRAMEILHRYVDSTNVCIDVDRVPGRSMSGEGGHWVVTAHRSGKRALATKFSAHKVSLLDINGIRTPDPRFVSGARTDCAGNGPGDRAVEWDPCNRSSGLVARRSGSMNWN